MKEAFVQLAPDRGAGAPLALALLAAACVAAAGCGYMKAPWSGSPAAGTASRTGAADTAAADSLGDADAPPGRRGETAGAAGFPSDSAASDSTAADSVSGPPRTVEALRERGPTYTPYDVSPQLLPGDWLSDLLADTLAPVVDRRDELSVEEFTLFWVLVDREGKVRDVVLHTSSRSDPFDQAARVVAERLRYRPALSGGEPVPVWVLARISLLMR